MINRLYFLTAPLLTLLLFGCTESEQQKWEKNTGYQPTQVTYLQNRIYHQLADKKSVEKG
jgi:outer membrane biogenesis lipoprotein LolB